MKPRFFKNNSNFICTVKNDLPEETCSGVQRQTHLLRELGASQVTRGEGDDEVNYSADCFKGTALHLCGKTLHFKI